MVIDFPEPVLPATNKCGILAKSTKTASPATSRPKGKTSKSLSKKRSDSTKFRKRTINFCLLGTSIPTSDWPGIGASIRIGWAAKAKERSFCRATILANLTPSAGFKV